MTHTLAGVDAPGSPWELSSLRGGFLFLVEIDAAAIAVEANLALNQGEQGVVLAAADVAAGMPLGAALAPARCPP